MLLPKVEGHSRTESIETVTIVYAATSSGLLWAYVLTVGFFDETIAGMKVSTGHIVIASLAGFVFFGVIFTGVKNRGIFSATAIRDASLAVSMCVLGLLSLDIGYSLFLNSSRSHLSEEGRSSDSNTWIGELYPQLYFPTEKNFRLHKPGRTVTGFHYGDMYRPMLLASPLLSSFVFSKKHVTVSINDDGFRERSELEGHKILAIGDSFTFGWGVDQNLSWVELLERSIGKPIYNMGIHDSSPKQEFLLLEQVIASRKLDLRGGVLLWMFFEGNDLEDSYGDLHPVQTPVSISARLFKGTIIEWLWSFPSIVRHESVFARFKDGRAEFSGLGGDNRTKSHYMIDGIASPFPLYTSPQFGEKLFSPDQIKRAQSDEQYVESHPNRRPLQKTFEHMESLSSREGFRVVVIIAPSDARLYGAEFKDFPTLSKESYFNILISRLAEKYGFDVVTLEESLRPYATRELLHFRDDDHWNERGHAAVADILDGFLRSRNIGIADGKVNTHVSVPEHSKGTTGTQSGRSAAR